MDCLTSGMRPARTVSAIDLGRGFVKGDGSAGLEQSGRVEVSAFSDKG